MAVTQYGTGPYKPTTSSTANNQNQYANVTQQANTTPSTAPVYTPNYNQQQNPYTSAWGTPPAPTAQQQTGPYNPNSPPGPGAPKVDPTQTGPYNPNPSQTPPAPQSPWSPPPQTSPYTPTQRPGPWTPQVPATPEYTPYTPYTTQQWGNPNDAAGGAWDPADFNTQALRDQYTAYMQASLPYWQFQQNASQYANDSNMQMYQNQQAFLEQQRMNQYNMGLTGRQPEMAEWQQQEAANQWGAQFGWQQQNDLFSQGLANQQMGLDTQRLTGDQWYQQQQVQLAGQQQAIEQAYNEGRLSNEQRALALNELTQRESQAYQYYQLAQQQAWNREQMAGELGWNREELAALQQDRQRQDELARWQQMQQMQMQQADIEAQRNNAILSATGRAAGMAPNVSWMRRF